MTKNIKWDKNHKIYEEALMTQKKRESIIEEFMKLYKDNIKTVPYTSFVEILDYLNGNPVRINSETYQITKLITDEMYDAMVELCSSFEMYID